VASVIVVDDHPRARRAASAPIRSSDSLELVGAAGSGAEALELAERLQPDIVIMDVRMPDLDGIETTRLLLARLPHLRVVLISTERAADLPADLADCGAAGFLSKQDLTLDALAAMIN
jgi:two-component system, NarL family, invasion response regulator UvrY